MGEFYTALLNGEIPYPTQKKFTLKSWDSYYDSYSEKDEDDERIFLAGKWTFNKLEFIRNQIKDVKFNSLQKEVALQCLMGFANRDTLILSELQKKTVPEKGELSEAYFNRKIKFNENSPKLSIVDKFESAIEALKYPLMQIFNSDNFATKKAKSLDDNLLLNSFRKIINYGQYYLIIERIWGECLWKGHSLDIKDEYDLVKTPTDRDAIIEAIAKFRLDSLTIHSTFLGVKIWKNDLSEEIKKDLVNINIVLNITRSGKLKKYVLGKYVYDKDQPPSSFIAELQAHELYFNNLLDEPLPKIPSITLRILFKVWHLFYSLADILKDRLPQETGVYKITKLKSFSTQIKKTDLIKLVVQSINVSFSDALKIIEIFSYNGKIDDDLWIKPFVECGDKLYFTYGALLVPNLLRSLENWMKYVGLDLSERGELFEDYVRYELEDSIHNGKIIKNAGVFSKSIIIPGDGKNEEIDLVFWLGNKFIIGELKCVVFPTSPLEDYRYHNRLVEAATQIKRKYEAVVNHKKEFLHQLSLSESFDIAKIEIVPLVITNLQFGSGKIINTIPVTDLLLVNRYLSEGNMPLLVKTSFDSEDNAEKIHNFYETEQEAIDNFESFVKNPPLLKLYSSLLKKKYNPFPAGNESDKHYVKEFLEVTLE